MSAFELALVAGLVVMIVMFGFFGLFFLGPWADKEDRPECIRRLLVAIAGIIALIYRYGIPIEWVWRSASIAILLGLVIELIETWYEGHDCYVESKNYCIATEGDFGLTIYIVAGCVIVGFLVTTITWSGLIITHA